jgi:hypothetical protein
MNGQKTMDKKLQFAYSAIADCQSTIRAIDVKLGALLTAAFLPLGVIDKIGAVFSSFKNSFSNYFPDVAIFIFFILWLLVVVALIRTLAAIDNPKAHISRSSEHSGSFYNGGEFEFRAVDIWFNRKSICSRSQVTQLATRYPEDSNILNELAFEHLKLIYIRDIKLYRLKYCFYGVLLWGLLGVCIFLITRMQ